MNIALITYLDKGAYASPTVANEDDTLLTFLQDKGLTIEKVIWNDPLVDWDKYELALLKSPWDYFDLIADFYDWLAMLKSKNIRLLNPIEVVTWNADKHYLQDIAKAGLNVTPSIFLDKGAEVDLSIYFDKLKSNQLIVKPAVSGGSKHTFKVTSGNAQAVSGKINTLIATEDFIVQPFLREIEANGEWSFLFFGGVFSHALLKKAKAGDFRVQHSFGGTIHPQTPSSAVVATAHQYVEQFAKGCLYARVDGTFVDNQFMLMELELIEPFLFLNLKEESYTHYYQALCGLIKL